MSSIYLFRRKTAANWTSQNPVLMDGELGLETDTGLFKFGNGSAAWSSRPYAGASVGVVPWGAITGTLSAQTDLAAALAAKQATLVSATNIKTINGNSILGSGDLVISGGGSVSDGDKGDITVSGSGATWTIDAGAVTVSKMANLAASTILGNNTGGAAAPIALSAAQVKTLLAIAAGDVSGLAAIATSGSAADLSAGTVPAARMPALTGDVTTSAGTVATTIANDAVTNAKAANMATATIKGRATAGTGDPEDLTGTQATALLDTFTSGAKGLVPASGGGTANFLRADGTFAAPPGGGGSPGGSSGEVQYNNAGAFAGAADVEIEGGQLRLPAISTPSVPATGGAKLYATDLGGIPWPAFSDSGSFDPTRLMDHMAFGKTHWFMPVNGTTTFVLGFVVSAQGTATAARFSVGSRRGRLRRIEYLVTTPSTSAVASLRDNIGSFNEGVTIGGSNAWEGGFYSVQHWGPATGASISTHRAFCGLRDNNAATDVEPSTRFNIVGMGWDAADANVQFMHNDASGAATKTDLGAGFPVPSADRADTYRLEMYSPPGTTQSVSYRVTHLESGAVATGTVTTNLPLNTQGLGSNTWMSVGGTSSVIGIAHGTTLIRTEY